MATRHYDRQIYGFFLPVHSKMLTLLGNADAARLAIHMRNLQRHYEEQHGVKDFYQTVPRISSRLQISESSAKRHLALLADKGYLSITSKGHPRKNHYRFDIDALERDLSAIPNDTHNLITDYGLRPEDLEPDVGSDAENLADSVRSNWTHQSGQIEPTSEFNLTSLSKREIREEEQSKTNLSKEPTADRTTNGSHPDGCPSGTDLFGEEPEPSKPKPDPALASKTAYNIRGFYLAPPEFQEVWKLWTDLGMGVKGPRKTSQGQSDPTVQKKIASICRKHGLATILAAVRAHHREHRAKNLEYHSNLKTFFRSKIGDYLATPDTGRPGQKPEPSSEEAKSKIADHLIGVLAKRAKSPGGLPVEVPPEHKRALLDDFVAAYQMQDARDSFAVNPDHLLDWGLAPLAESGKPYQPGAITDWVRSSIEKQKAKGGSPQT